MGTTESTMEKNHYGFRIYKIYKNSPLEQAGLRELEDFIIPPDGFVDENLKLYLNKNLNKNIDLLIFNLKSKCFNKVSVTPSLSWGEGKKGCLGAIVSLENYQTAHFRLLRVLKVKENSISNKIGLMPNEDYIIGIKPKSQEEIIPLNSKDSDPFSLLFDVIKSNLKKTVEFYVYNSKNGSKCLDVFLNIKKGEILGCDIGWGKCNEFPSTEANSNRELNNSELSFTNKSFVNSISLIQSDEDNISVESGEVKNTIDSCSDISPIHAYINDGKDSLLNS